MPLDLSYLRNAVGDEVVAAVPLGGGDVAESFRVELASGSVVFAKTHDRPPAFFFSTEAAGLEWMRAADAVRVPKVLAVSDVPPLLILEWVDEARRPPADSEEFGRALAAMHQAGAAGFGREDGRTTGSRGLPNQLCTTWPEFYTTQRLLPLCKLAQDEAVLSGADVEGLEAIALRLEELGGPTEAPARLHGDLWAGNRIVDQAGRSWLIDPACHGGHREFDLAMMQLFGGFDGATFQAYDEVHPIAAGWQERVLLHQLAPLLVHAIKFGGGYIGSTQAAIAHYR